MSTVYYNGVPINDPYSLPTMPNTTSSVDTSTFSNNQAFVLDLSSRIASVLSICAALSILATFIFWKRFRTSANRLITLMAFADLISALATLFGKLSISLTDYSPFCVFQAFLLQWGDLSSVFWTAAIAFNLIMVLFFTRSARDLDSLEKFYFFICFGIPFLVAFVPIFIWTEERGLVYGHDELWCWITDEWDILRLFLFYIPIWVIFIFNLSIYIVSSIRIWKKTANLPPQPNKSAATTAASYYSSRPTSYSDADTEIRRPPAFSTASVASVSSQISLTTVRTFRSRYLVRIGLFLLAYILAWLLPSINRIRLWIYGSSSVDLQENFMWFWMQEILVPLRGCINFLCYFVLAVANVLEEGKRSCDK